MILHHFTSNHSISAVRSSGLTKGMIPWQLLDNGAVRCRPGFQWLTREPSFDQPWAALGALPLSRTGWRITIAIPQEDVYRLKTWSEFATRHKPACAEDFAKISGNTDWYVFSGNIPKSWFIEVSRNIGDTHRPEIYV